jgi:hypothetical protein
MLPAYALAPYSYFHYAYEFITRKLACVLDSLVRVSRRVGENRFGRIVLRHVDPSHCCYSDLTSLILPFEKVSTTTRFDSAICILSPR